jgi:hypothetical protein
MSKRPQTLYGLADSPIDLAAFKIDHGDGTGQPGLIGQIIEGRLPGDLTRDDILDNITLCWLTNTGISAARHFNMLDRGVPFAAWNSQNCSPLRCGPRSDHCASRPVAGLCPRAAGPASGATVHGRIGSWRSVRGPGATLRVSASERCGRRSNYPVEATPTLWPWASANTPKLVPGTCWAG